MVMDFAPHCCFECWSPLDKQGIFRQLLDTARLAEFPSLYLLVCEAINLIPSIAISSMDEITTNWYTMWFHVTFGSWGQTVTRLTKQFESDGKQLQKFTDWYLGQASIASRDVPIEKIGANTEFKLSFTSPSIEELASSFRTDGHQSRTLSAFVLVGFRVRNGGCWRLWLAGARWKSAAGFWKARWPWGVQNLCNNNYKTTSSWIVLGAKYDAMMLLDSEMAQLIFGEIRAYIILFSDGSAGGRSSAWQRLDSQLPWSFTFVSSGSTLRQTFANLFITLSIVRLIDPAISLLKPNSWRSLLELCKWAPSGCFLSSSYNRRSQVEGKEKPLRSSKSQTNFCALVTLPILCSPLP